MLLIETARNKNRWLPVAVSAARYSNNKPEDDLYHRVKMF